MTSFEEIKHDKRIMETEIRAAIGKFIKKYPDVKFEISNVEIITQTLYNGAVVPISVHVETKIEIV